mgnify:CR=1 FL=1
MRNVVKVEHNADIFSELNRSGLELSGKTGTAQQSKTHPDHGLFVGFAPSANPEVAFAIRIANGYSSSRAAEVGRDVIKILLRQKRRQTKSLPERLLRLEAHPAVTKDKQRIILYKAQETIQNEL